MKRLLKDLPGLPKGTTFKQTDDGNWILTTPDGYEQKHNKGYVKGLMDRFANNPDWFEIAAQANVYNVIKENGIYAICDSCGQKTYPSKEYDYEHDNKIKEAKLLGEKMAMKKNVELIVEKILQQIHRNPPFQQEVDKLKERIK